MSVNWSGRIATWHQAIAIFKHWPVFGAGIDQFIAAQGLVPPVSVSGVEAVTSPHNTFLSVLAETGVVGALAILVLVYAIVALVRTCRRLARTDEDVIFGASVLGGLLGWFVLSQTFTEVYDPPSTIFLALILGAAAARVDQLARSRAVVVTRGSPVPQPASRPGVATPS